MVVVLVVRAGRCRRSRFAEVLATSDVPGGVVNILTGSPPTIAPWLASHMDVNAIDLTGVAGEHRAGAERSRSRRPTTSSGCAAHRRRARLDRRARTSTPMTDFLETKTVWHPIGV